MKLKRGFTLVELMIVIAIIAILISVLVASLSGSSDAARTAQCKGNMHNLAVAYMAVRVLPIDSESGLYSPYAEVGDDNSCPQASRYPGARGAVFPWMDYHRIGDPYVKDPDTRKRALADTNNFWVAIKGASSSYVCPEHKRYAEQKHLGDPLWSYALNGWFGCASKPLGQNGVRKFKDMAQKRADRILLFAELPAVRKVGTGTSDIQDGNLSGTELDGALDFYQGEVIGFNHTSNKKVVGNVAFFDGHVEQFQAPADENNIKELTKWLCDVDKYMDFDIGYDAGSGRYEKNEK